ncbi:MAG TPA: aminoglycoside phosphotransferase family protein [Acidimicrobiia bacterium]|nr:aminoglycoside phosphotransferase family protein [Acidimicrobiia bacterium]
MSENGASAGRRAVVRVDGAPVEVGGLTQALARAAGEGWEVTDCRGRSVQVSRTRPVVRYRVSYEHAGGSGSVLKIVIGKAYNRGDGEGTFELMQRLWDEGFSDANPLCIPEPIAWIPEERLLVQGKAPGHALYEHLDAPEEAIARVRKAGRWLAKLHATDVGTATQPLPLRYEAEKLATYAAGIAERHPQFGPRVRALAAEVSSIIEDANDGNMVPTHGDYQPKNIYVSSRKTSVIDFDRHALAPAGRDLAHFIGQCMTMSWVRTGSFERVAGWNEAFLDGYSDARRDGLEVLPAYLARTFLEILYYKLVVKPVKDPGFLPDWLERCEDWVGEPTVLRTGT